MTAASRPSQLRTAGTVTAHFRTAYDILARPKGSRTELESQTGTEHPNFLSGIYTGITMAHYHEIQRLPGVRWRRPSPAWPACWSPSSPRWCPLSCSAACRPRSCSPRSDLTGHLRQRRHTVVP